MDPIDPHRRLELGPAPPLASGTYRDVYPHPERPELLVKVLRGGIGLRADRPLRNVFKRLSQRANYRFLFREYDAWLAARIAWNDAAAPMPVAVPMWLQPTDRGLGMVVERIRGAGPDGRAASLGDLVREGRFDDTQLARLNAFIAAIFRSGIVTNDTNPSNLMLDEIAPVPRFVLVDGFGDATLLRVKDRSAWLRDRQRHRRFAGLARFIGGSWDPQTRQILR